MSGFRSALLVVCALSGAASAGEILVVESHGGGRRPADASALLAPLHDELRKLGYVDASPELVRRIDEKVSRAAGPMEASELADTRRLVDGGWRAWVDGDLEPAAEQMTQALQRLQQNPATVAQAPDLRDGIYRALVALALARKRQGRADEAASHMADLVRSFPDRDFNRTQYGPEAHDLYKKVKSELEQQPKGRLRVDVDDESAVVFLNERYDSVGGGEKEVLAGRYRVYVQKGNTPGRLRIVDVSAGASAAVQVSLRLDAVLTSTPKVFALTFPTQKERQESDASFATTLARSVGADGVVLLTIDEYEGRRAVIGRVLSVESAKPSRVGVVALEPAAPGEKALRGLARFLAEGKPSPGIIVPKGDFGEGGEGGGAGDAAPAWYADGLGWGLTAGGVVLAGVGAGLLVHSGTLRDDAQSSGDEGAAADLRERADSNELAGKVLVGVGAAVAVAGIVRLVLHDPGHPDSATPATATTTHAMPIVTPWFVGVHGSF